MDWIFDLPKELILVGFVVFSLIKHILDSKKAAQQEAEEEPENPFETWEEQPEYRQPAMPPPLVRVAVPPPLNPADSEAALKRQQDMMERLQRAKEAKQEKAVTTGGAEATRNRVGGGTKGAASAHNSVRGMLRDRNQTRRAIVLREVLGPPLGLR